MKILWLCNVMLPVIAEHLGKEATNKEGWLSGLCDVILERQQENEIELAIVFPVDKGFLDALRNSEKKLEVAKKQNSDCFQWIYKEQISIKKGNLICYGFYENVVTPEVYDVCLEQSMFTIAEDFQPDVIHCYGTEYPHTLAMCRVYPDKSKLLISIQGLCAVYANAYWANLPEKVINMVTFRDWLKKDTLRMQQQKFVLRGEHEIEAVKLAGNVTGRTNWDYHYTKEWNPNVCYYAMNETLRSNFYTEQWKEEKCIPYSIFLSQGDYPIKGLHYMLLALPLILKKYPDAKVYVAGNSIVNDTTLKDKIKISAYGKYLRSLIKENHLEERVVFLGRLNAQEMKQQYLKSHLFVCCSTIENSPNSLGEAMLLGMPCVSANVGGISSIFTDGQDGILYAGFQTAKNSFDKISSIQKEGEAALQENAEALAEAVLEIWSQPEKRKSYCIHARKHAQENHNKEVNYKRMLEIYNNIC